MQAVSLIESAKEQAASHNCWAYKVGTQTKSFDDGEPGGTAGQPILASIENSDLDAVCVLVIRCIASQCYQLYPHAAILSC